MSEWKLILSWIYSPTFGYREVVVWRIDTRQKFEKLLLDTVRFPLSREVSVVVVVWPCGRTAPCGV
jgi:hypothetical protein